MRLLRESVVRGTRNGDRTIKGNRIGRGRITRRRIDIRYRLKGNLGRGSVDISGRNIRRTIEIAEVIINIVGYQTR